MFTIRDELLQLPMTHHSIATRTLNMSAASGLINYEIAPAHYSKNSNMTPVKNLHSSPSFASVEGFDALTI